MANRFEVAPLQCAGAWQRASGRGRRLLCWVAVAAASWAPPVSGAEVVTWPTYLRAAPGRQAAVIGELSRDEPVAVRGCARGWCRIEVDGALGYVERDRVGPAGPPVAFEPAADRSDCFAARRIGYQGGQPLQVCPLRDTAAAPAAAASSPPKR